MKLRLLYFGILRERLGRREETRQCSDGLTVAGLIAELAEAHGIFALGAPSLRVAVNREYVGDDHVLRDDDEVAVIPPVAGGVAGPRMTTPARCSCVAGKRTRQAGRRPADGREI